LPDVPDGPGAPDAAGAPAADPGARRLGLGCGCLGAAWFAVPGLAAAVLFAAPFGDCGSADACHPDEGRDLAVGLALVAALTALLGTVFARWAREMQARHARRLLWAGLAAAAVAVLKVAVF